MDASYPELRDLFYTFDGIGYSFQITVYRDFYGHLIDKSFSAAEPKKFLDFIYDTSQRDYLEEIIQQIQRAAIDPDDQVRIAVSIVQHIPYDYQKCIYEIDINPNCTFRHPYEVIFDNNGICSEKSLLLAFILKELGYGTVLFSFDNENHMTVGIKVPKEFSYLNTGYAFIETTAVSVITDSYKYYNTFSRVENPTIELKSFPAIMEICDGKSFNSIFKEYFDLKELMDIEDNHIHEGSTYYTNRYYELLRKYGF